MNLPTPLFFFRIIIALADHGSELCERDHALSTIQPQWKEAGDMLRLLASSRYWSILIASFDDSHWLLERQRDRLAEAQRRRLEALAAQQEAAVREEDAIIEHLTVRVLAADAAHTRSTEELNHMIQRLRNHFSAWDAVMLSLIKNWQSGEGDALWAWAELKMLKDNNPQSWGKTMGRAGDCWQILWHNG